MKKIIFFSFLAGFLLIGSAFAHGEDPNDHSADLDRSVDASAHSMGSASVQLPDPGLTPDSPFYLLDGLFESVKLTFSFGTEAKANANLDIALEKISEAKAMAEAENQESFDKAMEKYESHVGKATEKIEKLKVDNEAQAKVVAERIALVTQTHIDVLLEVYSKAPEQARDGLNRAINASTKARNRQIERFNNTLDMRLEMDSESSSDMEKEESDTSVEIEGETSVENDSTSVEVEGEVELKN